MIHDKTFSETQLNVSIEIQEQLERFRQEHRRLTERLRIRHQNGGDALTLAQERTASLDRVVESVWKWTSESSLCCVAVGEYGAGALSPHSKVETLFLMKPAQRDDRVRQIVSAMNQQFAGHSLLLPPKDCLQKAQTEPTLLRSLLSARWVAGDFSAFTDWSKRFHANFHRQRYGLITELARLSAQERQNHSPSEIEMDLTAHWGGIRDFQTFWYCLQLCGGGSSLDRVLSEARMRATEWQTLLLSYSQLLRIRHHLHFRADTQNDLLTKDLASSLAQEFGSLDRDKPKAPELFLQLALRCRSAIHRSFQRFVSRCRSKLNPEGDQKRIQYLKSLSESQVQLSEPSPERWMKVVRYSQTEPSLLSEFFKDIVHDHLQDVLAWDAPAVHEEFRSILKNKGKVGAALRSLHELGILGRYLPEFGRIESFPELDRAHHWTVDEHTLRSIEIIDEVVRSSDPALHDYQRVLEEVAEPHLLYLALLLHDCGKGLGPGHAAQSERLAAGALQRVGMDHDSRAKILTLIRHHMLLAHVSQRRDIDDPLIVQEVCDVVETADNLNMLLLVSYADLRANGQQAWSERKDFLLWALYFKVFDRLMFGDEVTPPEHTRVAAIQRKVLEHAGPGVSRDAVLRHFLLLPEKYALYTPLPQILSHIRLCERLQDQPVVTEWISHPQAGYTDLFVSTNDVPGRFAQIAGSLTSLDVSILSAQLNTRDDGIVIDSFQVCDATGKALVEPEFWKKVDRLLIDVIRGDKSVDELLSRRLTSGTEVRKKSGATPRIRIDNEISSQSTVIEVQSEDRLGLGYMIARCLAELGLNILSAKLGTEKSHAFDVFYVQTQSGGKISSSFQMTEVLEQLRSRLSY
ncbi:MAG: HD domain-containing protein [Acidobacteriota bacterium]